MGITYSIKFDKDSINIDDSVVENLNKEAKKFNRQAERFVDIARNQYKDRKEKKEENNKNLEEIVDRCKKLFIERQLSECDQHKLWRSLRGVDDQCKQFDLDLLECASDYLKSTGTRI